MKISILSTFYNDQKMLRRVMDSVLMQTYPNIEHVIVDAASEDDSVSLLREYELKYTESGKILKWISEPDGGRYEGFNKAFELSTGDYIMVNAPDPYADKFVFHELSTILVEHTPDYVYGGMYYQKNGRIIRRWTGKPGNWKLGWMVATPTLCVRRILMEKYGPFDTSNPIAADYKFQIDLFRDKTLKSYSWNRVMVIYYAGGVSNGGVRGKLNSILDGQKALENCGVKFAYFVTICRILRGIFDYLFVVHKKVEILPEERISD